MIFCVALVTFSINANAERKSVFGHVLVNLFDQNNKFLWIRENDTQPKYPVAMAMSNLKGCAVLTFDLNQSGSIQNIKLLNAQPTRKLGSEARIALRKWKWINVSDKPVKDIESRKVRIDYCIGGKSEEESQLLCQQQAKRECK